MCLATRNCASFVDGEQVGYQVGAGALGIYEIRCGLKVLKKWIEAAEEKLPSKPPRKIKLDDERIAVSSLLTAMENGI